MIISFFNLINYVSVKSHENNTVFAELCIYIIVDIISLPILCFLVSHGTHTYCVQCTVSTVRFGRPKTINFSNKISNVLAQDY